MADIAEDHETIEHPARVSSKGQVTIPQHFRRRNGIRTGTAIAFSQQGDAILMRKVAARRGRRSAEEDFAAYLDRVAGAIDLGMTSDQFMDLLRGE